MTHLTNSLPPEPTAFAALIDAQPAPIRDTFNYLLCLLTAKRGVLRLVETRPGADGEVAVFRSSAGETFTIVRPPLAPDIEARIRTTLRDIPDEDMP
jgi:hypothetical protein